MLEGLQTEIDNNPSFAGASVKYILNTLNQDGSAQTETWAVMDTVTKVPKGDMMALLSTESQEKIFDFLAAPTTAPAKGFNLFFYAHDQFTVTDAVFRGTIQLLHDPLTLITATERDEILRLGERSISRAEELFGRKLTEGDFE
jgi:hypothetical protein